MKARSLPIRSVGAHCVFDSSGVWSIEWCVAHLAASLCRAMRPSTVPNHRNYQLECAALRTPSTSCASTRQIVKSIQARSLITTTSIHCLNFAGCARTCLTLVCCRFQDRFVTSAFKKKMQELKQAEAEEASIAAREGTIAGSGLQAQMR